MYIRIIFPYIPYLNEYDLTMFKVKKNEIFFLNFYQMNQFT